MTEALQNFEAVKGDEKILRIPVTENGWPRILTGLTADWDLSTAAGAASLLSKATGGSGITIPAAATGAAQSATTAAIVLANAEPATDGLYQGRHVQITAGKGIGQYRTGIKYNGITRELTVDRGWDIIPDNTSTYKIVDSSLEIVIDPADTTSIGVGSFYHRARITDGASKPATVTIGTAEIVDGIA